MPVARSEFAAGVRAVLPLLLGVIPFGTIYGVLALAVGIPPAAAQVMSAVVFAGSAQFVAVQLIGAGTPAVVVLLTTFVINLRHVLYSASLAPCLAPLRRPWKWLLAFLLTDEAYALSIVRYRRGTPDSIGHWYALGVSLTLWVSWQSSTAVGIYLGAQVPPSWSLDFTLALTLIALVVPALDGGAAIAAAVIAGFIAVLAAGLPFKLGLMLAASCGILAGLIAEQRA